MTVETATAKSIYTADGATTGFDFNFRVLDAAHVSVYLSDIDGYADPSSYQVEVGSAGGRVVLSAPPSSGTQIAILRNVPINQLMDLQDNQSFYPDTLERAFDKVTMVCQQLSEELGRKVDGTTPAGTSAKDQAAYWAALNAAVAMAAAAKQEALDAAGRAEAAAKHSGRTVGEIFYTANGHAPDGAFKLDGSEVDCSDSKFDAFWELVTTGYVPICNAAVYASDITAYGQCGRFVKVSDTPRKVKLPTVNRFIKANGTKGAAALDKQIDVGGAAASGSFVVPVNYKSNALPNQASAEGCFSMSSQYSSRGVDGGNAASYDYKYTLTLDGGETLDAAHAGSEVEPRSVSYDCYIQLYASVSGAVPSSGIFNSLTFSAADFNYSIIESRCTPELMTYGSWSVPMASLGLQKPTLMFLTYNGVRQSEGWQNTIIQNAGIIKCQFCDYPDGMSGTWTLHYLGGSAYTPITSGGGVSSGGEVSSGGGVSSGGEVSSGGGQSSSGTTLVLSSGAVTYDSWEQLFSAGSAGIASAAAYNQSLTYPFSAHLVRLSSIYAANGMVGGETAICGSCGAAGTHIGTPGSGTDEKNVHAFYSGGRIEVMNLCDSHCSAKVSTGWAEITSMEDAATIQQQEA